MPHGAALLISRQLLGPVESKKSPPSFYSHAADVQVFFFSEHMVCPPLELLLLLMMSLTVRHGAKCCCSAPSPLFSPACCLPAVVCHPPDVGVRLFFFFFSEDSRRTNLGEANTRSSRGQVRIKAAHICWHAPRPARLRQITSELNCFSINFCWVFFFLRCGVELSG